MRRAPWFLFLQFFCLKNSFSNKKKISKNFFGVYFSKMTYFWTTPAPSSDFFQKNIFCCIDFRNITPFLYFSNYSQKTFFQDLITPKKKNSTLKKALKKCILQNLDTWMTVSEHLGKTKGSKGVNNFKSDGFIKSSDRN